jgi:glutathione synthetase
MLDKPTEIELKKAATTGIVHDPATLKNALAATNGHAHNGHSVNESANNGLKIGHAANGVKNGHTNGLKNGYSNDFSNRTQHGNAGTYVLDSVKNEQELNELVEYAIDYAHSIGLIGRTAEHKGTSDVAEAPPLSLLPSPFPRELYEQAISVQKTLNELYFRISMDHDFLVESYKDVVKSDMFIKRLMEMMEIVHVEGIHQKISLCVQRADYLSHWDEKTKCAELKQVEVYIGQIGGPGCATKASKLHSRMLEKLQAMNGGEHFPSLLDSAYVPENRPRNRMAQTLYEAWKMFGDPQAVMVLVNQPDLFPICHFEQLQFAVFQMEDLAKADGYRLNILRMNFEECAKRLQLDEVNGFSLYADGNKKVALVHMGYGYMAEHYPTEKEWKIRLDMERSTAIISPNVRLQLTGTKKIQQVISKPGVLEHFFPGEDARLAELRQTFTQLWSIETNDQKTMAVIQEAIKTPKKFVLKANMGAGKGNYFDEEMVEKLQTMPLEERGAYILQKKIVPVEAKNYMLRPFKAPHLETVVSEMGIYGSILSDSAEMKVLWNSVDGYLLRSKAANVNQGGVSEGSGVIDSLLLVENTDFH